MSPEIHMTGTLDPRSSWGPAVSCQIAKTFETIGTKSAFVIMREAFYGATRFEEFVERTDMSEPVVSARLRELTDEGLLEKVPYQEPGQRTRNAYQLTEKGSDLLPVLVAMMRWGDRWLFPEGGRVDLTHTGCGSPVNAVLQCEAGHEVAPDQLDLSVKPRESQTAG
jgi:DNA-binding HxlR family transcriptional regulator